MTVADRQPEAAPARIAPLPNLPLFHKLSGRKVVLAGGSEASLWKAELLRAAGADLIVLAGAQSDRFASVEGTTVLAREWRPSDLDQAAIAVADLPEGEARRFADAARVRGIPVNCIDRPEYCDFQFGTIVNRAPVVLAISTDGAAPMLGQSIRTRIESVLPLGLTGWAKAAKAWRPRLRERLERFDDRREFWKRFVTAAWSNAGRPPAEADFEDLIAGDVEAPRGSVALVGAGPGDPELLTLKAVRALQGATIILYDDLVGPEILELARREARRVRVGKTGHGPSCRQLEINSRIVELALAGETVVRLKGGDPLVFGRATEELDACRAAGVPVSIIPGISAAQGAAASLGFSLSERGRSRRIQFVTGHGADGKLPADIDWGAVADRKATTILYMPRRTLDEFVRRALAKGLDPATPAVAIASATLPEEVHVGAPISDLAVAAASLPAGVPVVVVIGWVARSHADLPAGLLAFPGVAPAQSKALAS